MLFTKRFWPGIADGSITLTFRRWRRRQVVPGGRYRTAAGIIEVESVHVVATESVTDVDAVSAGFASAADLISELRDAPDLPLYRVAFHRVWEPDPRDELARQDDLSAEDVAAIARRLSRLDRAAAKGPWTHAVLDAVAGHPGVRAPDLAASFGRETAPFKRDVRKLKNLGLTISLRIGYRLSPRGEAYLNALRGGG